MSDAGLEADVRMIMVVCGDRTRTEALSKWMDSLVEENIVLMSMLAESGDECRATRLQHLASQISSYRRIKDAAQRALNLAEGQPPDAGGQELAGGDAV